MVERDFQMATFIGTGRPVSKAALPVNWDIKIGKYFLTLKICISPIIWDIKIGKIFSARKRCVSPTIPHLAKPCKEGYFGGKDVAFFSPPSFLLADA